MCCVLFRQHRKCKGKWCHISRITRTSPSYLVNTNAADDPATEVTTSHNIYIVCSRIIWVPGWKILFNNGIGLTFSWQINSYGFHNAFIFIVYYSDITHTSWHLNSSHNRMFVQEHVHANNKQGKSEGFESCDRPIVRKRPVWVKIGDVLSRVTLKFDGWPWKTIGHLSFACFKLCATFHSHRWIQTGVAVRKRPIWVKFDDFYSRVTLKFDVWPWKTIGHLYYATSSSIHHCLAIGVFRLELQSGNAQFGSKSMIFLAVWPCNLTYDLEKR